MNLEDILLKQFGFNTFRPGQKEVIESLLRGKDTLAMLPTGSGKSLCYQFPAYVLKKSVLIVSPLLSLMQDQAEQLKMRGEKSVITLNSFLTYEKKREAIEHLDSYRFIYLSPEMLAIPRIIERLQKLEIGLFVIDEAHCISQWGYDFRTDYLNLGNVRSILNNPLTLALTATATKTVQTDIKDKLKLEQPKEVITSVDRSNIAYMVEEFSSYDEKLKRLMQLVNSFDGAAIIYFSSKKAAESVATFLQENGVKNIDYYHGGMEQEQRMLIQQQFLRGQLRIICATSAFGMGVNKNNVRVVIHFHLPQGMEAYLQEIGRAGRDGLQSVAILLYCDGDEGLPLHLVEQQLPTNYQIEQTCASLHEVGIWNIEPKLEIDLREMYTLTDVQWRWITHYVKEFEQEEPLLITEKLKQIAQTRRVENQTKLERFFRWIAVEDCRRENILSYFDVMLTEKNQTCCDRCGVVTEELLEILPHDEQAGRALKKTWKQELAAILIGEAKNIEEQTS
ncbi:RecQ family ATP-dependent DNA helicase [Peribacillus huizhouensis]|uniref:ATP-dependent DNA helicase RecQ n=1 Tax=Peribacillus huizhouensis TaxID=1501239 RepID=A0ABR6CQP2_9BACI|nr:RecQ family ATP-dependent DNA helicase [Peribacillus huizhouensis]MBA9027236.1 ATP-dependent DNA helicase RecQ [Peribacillus huizhouensis]